MVSDTNFSLEESVMRRGLLILIVLVPLTSTVAANLSCDDASPADLVLENSRVYGAGPGFATIRILDDRICAVENGSAPSSAGTTIDLSGRTVLPGMIDSHVHLFPMGASTGIDSDAALDQFIRDELPGRLRDYLERGVTTVFSVGDAWPAVRYLRQRIESGEVSGPRLLMTGPILTAPDGYPAVTICAGSPWCRSHLTVELRNESHARRIVGELAADGVDAIKVVYDDARAEKLDANLISVVTREAHARNLPVVAHTTKVRDALEVAELGVNVLAHMPSGGIVDREFATQLQQRGVIIISTAGVYAPIIGPDGTQTTVFGLRYGPPFDRFYAQGLANTRALIVQGASVAFGSGTAMFVPSQSLDGEINALSEVPFTPPQLIDALTINAARALGKEADLGSVSVGKLADLVIVDTNSAGDVVSADVVMVIKNGRIVVDRR